MNPTLDQLRYFCEIAHTGNFSRAAERLNISQPPLSRQIANLENILGTILFERTPKGVHLTASGDQFLKDAEEILALVQHAGRNASAAGRGEFGQLTIGFTMCAAYSVVPPLLRNFKKKFPLVSTKVRELLPSAIEASLSDGSIDVAISFPSNTALEFETLLLLREPLMLVMSDGHPLAKKATIKVESLSGETFLIVPHDQAPSLHDTIVGRCRSAGFDPIIGLEIYLQQTIVNFAAEGMGIAFVPKSMRRSQIKGSIFKNVDEPPMLDQLLYWSPRNMNPCLRTFLEIARPLQTET